MSFSYDNIFIIKELYHEGKITEEEYFSSLRKMVSDGIDYLRELDRNEHKNEEGE